MDKRGKKNEKRIVGDGKDIHCYFSFRGDIPYILDTDEFPQAYTGIQSFPVICVTETDSS